MTDTAAQPFGLRAGLNRPVTLIFFGYTNCPDVCTGIMTDMASVRNRLTPEQRNRVDIVVVSTDPVRDTPAALGAYLARIDPGFIGLTGDLATIRTAADALGVGIDDAHPLPSGGYEVAHGAQVIGFGTDHRAHVVWTPGTSIGDLKADVEQLLVGR